ncbi:MAG: SDR family NAD(P)-dependent oxidoreductase [Ramlibacter sp.]|nr:SDR family NAD(P)-dependent oxidoreductase [Ramlibacter sp.]
MPGPASILITGASSGIGAALAMSYAAPGAHLALLGRSAQRLAEIAARCKERGAMATVLALDVTDQAAMKEAIAGIDGRYPLDLVVANAGIAKNQESPDFARQLVGTNIVGMLNTVEPALEAMLPRQRGHIAVMSSLAAFRAFGGPPGYAGSKAWARLYGEALRGRYAGKGIAVSVVCPGFVATPMTQGAAKGGMSAEDAAETIKAGLARNLPRISFPRDMALRTWLANALPDWWTDRAIRRKWQASQRK